MKIRVLCIILYLLIPCYVCILRADLEEEEVIKAEIPEEEIISAEVPKEEVIEVEIPRQWSKRVLLATYPRSGNHWVRYLIEEATHIATSSVYCDQDPPHILEPFPWGAYCVEHGYEGKCRYPKPGEKIVIKTHFPALMGRDLDFLPPVKVIRIIRHPLDSFYSWYIRQSPDPQFRIPRKDLERYIDLWLKFQDYWDRQPNVVTISYEGLYMNPRLYLKVILEAIGYKVSSDDIKRAIAKNPPRGGGLLKHAHHYHKNDLNLIQWRLGDMMKKHNYKMPKD